jgi:hypothetical protein
MWTFPAPPQRSEWKALPFQPEYTEILQAISESEDEYEQCLGELAFAVFLLGHNYHLAPGDYEQLLGSGTEPSVSGSWQRSFGHFAQEHLRSLGEASPAATADPSVSPTLGTASRLISWLRDHLQLRRSSVESRGL